MYNKKLMHKAGWLVTTSALVLSTAAHAGDIRVAALEQNPAVMAKVDSLHTKINDRTLSAASALKRGMRYMKTAKSRKDHLVAFEYLNYAAKRGLPEAQFQCAIMYLDNQYTPGDDARAMQLLRNASAQGHKQAAIALNYIQYAEDGIGC